MQEDCMEVHIKPSGYLHITSRTDLALYSGYTIPHSSTGSASILSYHYCKG